MNDTMCQKISPSIVRSAVASQNRRHRGRRNKALRFVLIALSVVALRSCCSCSNPRAWEPSSEAVALMSLSAAKQMRPRLGRSNNKICNPGE